MSIEFRCHACNRLLRTGDDTAGKQAKCPDCGAVVAVPDGSADAPLAAPLPSPSPAGNPFGSGAAGHEPADETGNPYQSPSAHAMAPAYTPTQGEFTPTRIDLEDVFSRTWTIFKEQWGTCLAAFVVVLVINVVTQIPLRVLKGLTQADLSMLPLLILAYIIVNLFTFWVGLGQALYFLKIARGEPAELSDLFTGGRYFLPVLGAAILTTLIVMCGLVLLIIPGIILALMFSQYYYLILDRDVGVMDSLSISKDLTDGNKLTLFLVGLVMSAIFCVIVVLTCGIGFLAVGPFMTLLFPVTYLAMTGQPTADQIVYGPPAE